MRKNPKRLISLILLIFIFVSFFLLKDFVKNKFFPEKVDQPFPTISPNKVSQVIFETNDLKEIAYKKNSEWFIKKENIEYQADSQRINQIIINISLIIKSEIISSNKKNHKNLGIDKDKITLKTKDHLYTLYIGQLSGTENNYVRVAEEDDVFTAPGLTAVFTPFDYRDLNVHLITDENQITEISTGDIELFKKSGQWLVDDKLAKKDRVDFFLNDLKTLKAIDIFPEDPKLGLTGSGAEFFIVITENNKKTYLQFHKIDADNYYLKTTKNNFLYLIPNVYAASLKKEEKDFIE